MSQLFKTKRQANFEDFKRFGPVNELVEQKNLVFNKVVYKLGSFWNSIHSCYKLAHSCQKKPNLHTNSLNELQFLILTFFVKTVSSLGNMRSHFL
jgi:hypothetical protein